MLVDKSPFVKRDNLVSLQVQSLGHVVAGRLIMIKIDITWHLLLIDPELETDFMKSS